MHGRAMSPPVSDCPAGSPEAPLLRSLDMGFLAGHRCCGALDRLLLPRARSQEADGEITGLAATNGRGRGMGGTCLVCV